MRRPLFFFAAKKNKSIPSNFVARWFLTVVTWRQRRGLAATGRILTKRLISQALPLRIQFINAQQALVITILIGREKFRKEVGTKKKKTDLGGNLKPRSKGMICHTFWRQLEVKFQPGSCKNMTQVIDSSRSGDKIYDVNSSKVILVIE